MNKKVVKAIVIFLILVMVGASIATIVGYLM